MSALLPARTPRAAFGELLRCEAKVAWRQPIGLIFGVALPVLLLIIFALIPAMNKPEARLGNLTPFTVYFPVLISFVAAALALISLPAHLATYREQGILRRLSTTPVPPAWMLAAQVVVNLVLAVVALAVLVVVGVLGFSLHAPQAAGGFTLVIVLGVAAMFAIGLWISAVARTANAATILGQIILYPVLFFSGLYVPREVMAPVLQRIGDWTPTGAAASALKDAMFGTFPAPQPLLVLGGYTVLCGFLAVRFFRWE
ncbi:ABC transporter permease [Amycolatopsis alkalitolerans]|uniref:Transport permease protein n=1 Tax=Amycolatopsis alkalitolerans TaxID=2547244 RepID=A0A5C4M3V9_9PSEU|nr:ABC transporter permease [Amycolatopsis alkalitolerans]TNC27743.1 ABC transporter permease [Amycolatopsis alkalitolerans]